MRKLLAIITILSGSFNHSFGQLPIEDLANDNLRLSVKLYLHDVNIEHLTPLWESWEILYTSSNFNDYGLHWNVVALFNRNTGDLNRIHLSMLTGDASETIYKVIAKQFALKTATSQYISKMSRLVALNNPSSLPLKNIRFMVDAENEPELIKMIGVDREDVVRIIKYPKGEDEVLPYEKQRKKRSYK